MRRSKPAPDKPAPVRTLPADVSITRTRKDATTDLLRDASPACIVDMTDDGRLVVQILTDAEGEFRVEFSPERTDTIRRRLGR
jgi:hypothetical protein